MIVTRGLGRDIDVIGLLVGFGLGRRIIKVVRSIRRPISAKMPLKYQINPRFRQGR